MQAKWLINQEKDVNSIQTHLFQVKETTVNFLQLTLRHLKRHRKAFYIIGFSLLLILIILFSLRGVFLRSVVDQVKEKFSMRFHGYLIIEKAEFTGLRTIAFQGVSMGDSSSVDTLFSGKKLEVTIGWRSLLTFNPSFSELNGYNIQLNLVRADSSSNYLFLLKQRAITIKDTTTSDPVDYAGQVRRLFTLLFEVIPSHCNLYNLRLRANIDQNKFEINAPKYTIRNGGFINNISVITHDTTRVWTIEGEVNRSEQKGNFKIYGKEPLLIPWLDGRFNARVLFDTLQFSIEEGEAADTTFRLISRAGVSGLLISQPMISNRLVRFTQLKGELDLNISPSQLEVDSSSYALINGLKVNPYLNVTPSKPFKVKLEVHKRHFPAQQLFDALPAGLFSNLEGMVVEGNLSYDLSFSLDMDKPDSLVFDSDLRGEKFRIKKYGSTPLTLINGPFMHTVYEYGRPVRTFLVGEGNPGYIPLNQISPFLQSAIMTSEDGAFYYHGGFLPDAFRDAMITNIKEKRFARGGSTISMQLVKNVFLSRNKTVTRKLEEALIVWLIERQRLSSKARMYEVYLNIIEMAPMMYGVQEGAHFYFAKDASRLNLSESILLASLVPHPKWFKYSFNADGSPKEWLNDYYHLMVTKMVSKGFITETDALGVTTDFKITGPALKFLSPNDTIAADSLKKEIFNPNLTLDK